MLVARVLTVAVALPLFLGVLWLGGLPFRLLTALLSALAFGEYSRLLAARGVRLPAVAGGLMCAALVMATGLKGQSGLAAALLAGTLLSLALAVFRPDRWTARDGLAAVAGLLYCGWLTAHWALLRDRGLWPLLFAFVCTWVTDTLAYFGGRLLGRHKLAPEVSPGKTWEGFAAGAIGSTLVGAGLGAWVGRPGELLVPGLLGLGVALIGQVGDLAESALKRYVGVKDSGALLPGHGGILDRFDAALFTVPALYYAVTLAGG